MTRAPADASPNTTRRRFSRASPSASGLLSWTRRRLRSARGTYTAGPPASTPRQTPATAAGHSRISAESPSSSSSCTTGLSRTFATPSSPGSTCAVAPATSPTSRPSLTRTAHAKATQSRPTTRAPSSPRLTRFPTTPSSRTSTRRPGAGRAVRASSPDRLSALARGPPLCLAPSVVLRVGPRC